MKEQFELQLPDLLYFVKASCHENLHSILDILSVDAHELTTMTELPQQLHGFLLGFIRSLKVHLDHEEKMLFAPYKGMKTAHTIPHLVDDHDQLKADLLAIRKMTHNYQLLDDPGKPLHNFYKQLKEMDRILLNHIQIEDHILFPMILSM